MWLAHRRLAHRSQLGRGHSVAESLERRLLLSMVTWTGAAGDNQWSTLTNWSSGALPGKTDDVVINLATNPTIQLASGTQSVKSVTSSDPLNITGGTLQIAATFQSSATTTLAGGTLQGAAITETGGASLVLSSGTLTQDTIESGTTAATSGFANITIAGLTLNGTFDVGSANGAQFGTITFLGTQALSGTGMVQLGGSVNNTIYARGDDGSNPATLTIGSGILIDGGGGSITGFFAGDSIVNQGTIDGNTAGQTIGLSGSFRGGGSTFLNSGTVEETAAGTMDIGSLSTSVGLNSPWSNTGTYAVSGGGTLNLLATFTTAQIGSVTNTGGRVNLAGVLSNAGATLTLNSTTGGWFLAGGTVSGGTITDTAADPLSFATTVSGNNSTLSGVTVSTGSVLNGTVGNDAQFAEVTNGLTLNGTLDVGSTSGSTILELEFLGSQMLGGTGNVIFGGSSGNEFRAQSPNGGVTGAQLTLGSGLTIQGATGDFTTEYSVDSVVNQASISNTSAGTFTFDASNFINQGTITAQNNSTIVLSGTSWINTGTLNVQPTGILDLEGSFTTAAIGPLTNAGGTVNLAGVVNNNGSTLALNSTSGGWFLAGGTIEGGTFTDIPGDLLTYAISLHGSQSTLSGVTIPAGTTINGTVGNDLQAGVITNGLTLNGTLEVGSSTGSTALELIFFGSQTLTGTGTIIFGDSSGNELRAQSVDGVTGATLTIASGLSIQGGNGEITAEFPIDSVINQANISLNSSTFTISADNWLNQGVITADNLTTLTLSGTAWSNHGTLNILDGSSLLLEGSNYTLPASGTISAATGVVYIMGTFNNAGATLSLNTNSGNWFLGNADFPGTISGGTITTSQTAVLGVAQAGGTLSGVTLAGILAVKPVFLSDINPVFVTGGLTLQGGTVNISGPSSIKFEGTQTLGGTGAVNLTGVGAGNGMLIPNAGDVLTIGSGVTILGDSGQIGSTGGGTLTLQGTIEANNAGTLTVESNTNFSGNTLTGGTWGAIGGGTLELLGATIVNNAARLVLSGPGAALDSNTTGANALAGFVSNTTTGALTIASGANLTTSASFSNAGSVTLDTTSTLAIGGAGVYIQSGGSTLLGGGTLGSAGNSINITGGELSGPGTINGNLTNSGTVDLGANPGILTLNGNFTQAAAGTLILKVGGATAGTTLDQVNISGTATLGGALTALLINGFAPNVEESFDVLNFASSSGGFSKFNSPLIGSSPAFVTSSTATAVDLVGATSAPDLAVTGVTFGPSTASIGQNITVNYTVANLGTVATTAGSWTDSIYLSTGAALSSSATLLGRATHTGDLAALSNYSGMLTAATPGVSQGNYYIIVVADSGEVVADVNRADNIGAAASPLTVSVPPLTLASPISGTIAKGQKIYYQLNVTPGNNVEIQANYNVSDEAELLVRYNALPTTSSFDESATDPTVLNPLLLLPGGQGGTYYILLRGLDGAGSGQPFTLQAGVVPFALDSFDVPSASNQGNVTMHLKGSGFTPETMVSLNNTSASIAPQSTTFINSNELIATFDLSGEPTGNFALKAVDGGHSSIAPKAFQITSASAAAASDLVLFLECAGAGLPDMPAYLAVGIRNNGNTDLQAPLFDLIGKNVLGATELDIYFGGITLAPGQLDSPSAGQGDIKFTAFPDEPGTVSTWTLQAVPPATTINYSDLVSERPTNIPSAAWNAIISNLASNIGPTVTDLENAFQADSVYLAQLGESVADQNTLMAFEFAKAADLSPTPTLSSVTDSNSIEPGLSLEVQRAYVPSILTRNTLGLFGYGWTSNWDTNAVTDSVGNVFVEDGAISRDFVLQPDGTYQDSIPDGATLTLSKGVYTMTDIGGTVTSFLANGQLDYVQDRSGNRITAGYTGGMLTTLTHSNGDQMTLSYNGQGLVSQIKGADGNVTTYSYDANHQLISATGPNGNEVYTYVNGQGIAEEHALASVTNPDGTKEHFNYDSQGRLTRQSGDGGSGAMTYAYLSPGGYTMTNANGATTTTLVDVNGEPAYIKDPLGNIETMTYNSRGEQVLESFPGGTASSTTYNDNGSVATQSDPLGNTINLISDPQTGALQSLEDANGNTTSFSYTSNGLLSSILNANGTSTSYVYNSLGEFTSSTDELGRVTHYTYDNNGDLIRRDNPDGTSDTYGYDSNGNLISVTDASGTISMTFNSARALTQVVYPNGQFIDYTYGPGNLLTQLTDQSGYAENYAYNSLGQLEEVTDGTGAMIASYTYNLAGQMTSIVHGNGTYTTYAYDADGNLIHLINFAPDSSINSRFDYTYDARGNVTSMTTLTGTTTYGYDADRQLTSVTLPSGETITYAYDAMGNRTIVSDSGGTTAYTSNNMNQYMSVGSYTYSYDAEGNLTMSGGAGGNTSYTYDDRDRLIKVQTPTDTQTFTYNALGSLIATTDNGTTTQYLIDATNPGNVLAEYDGSGNLIANFAYGNGLVSQINPSGARLYYDFDVTGSTAGLSGSTGSYVVSYNYLPFGELQSSTGSLGNPFQYNGQYGVMTQGNGVDFMRARFYSPSIGRFINEDPSGLSGGLNLYAFVSNNPLAFQDPSGLGGWGLNGNSSSLGIGFGKRDTFAETLGISGFLYQNVVQPLAALVSRGGPLAVVGLAIFDAFIVFYEIPYQSWLLYKTAFPNVVNGADLPPAPPSLTVDYAVIGPHDPNYIEGPAGAGSQHFLPVNGSLPYVIGFENESTATAPAHVVQVTQQLDSNLDWSTFQLGSFSFGGQSFDIPSGLTSYSTRIDELATLGVFVDVNADFNVATGLLTWTFTTIDPTTLDDPVGNALEGFLPPNLSPPEGEGTISYSVQPKSGDPTGAPINGQATVTFDAGLPDQSSLETAAILNTIDAGAPTSSVLPLPTSETSPAFTLNWSGHDDPGGSGIAFFNIYFSTDGGAFAPFLLNTTQTSATFTGLAGHSYAFYSAAVDNVGNAQPTPTSAQAGTVVLFTPAFSNLSIPSTISFGTPIVSFSGVISAGSNFPPAGEFVMVTLNGVTHSAAISANGVFSTIFDTASLPASATLYTVTYAYPGDATFASASDSTSTTLTVNSAVTISTPFLANWTVNQPGYSQQITAGGGTGALTFAITAGTLPTGLTLLASGLLSGKPTVAGPYTFTVTATDSIGASGSQAYTVVINSTLTITTPFLANGTVNQPGYSQQIMAIGGTGSDSFAVTAGTLPTGLILSTSGLLSGTPTVAGPYTFTVTATDAVGASGSQTYTVVINPASATNVTSDVSFTRSGYTYNRTTRRFYQTITITNTSSQTLSGPLSLVLDGLSSGVSLFGASGTSSDGSPYLTLSANSLAPGQSISLTLQFVDPTNAGISYDPQLFEGPNV